MSKLQFSETDINSSFLNRAVRNFLFSGIGTVGTFVVAFVFAGLTIRYLGEARAGYFMALAALVGLNAFLGDFGLGTPAVRRVAILNAEKDFSKARVVVGSVMTASFVSSLVLAFPIMAFFPQIFIWSRLDAIYQADAFWATFFTMGSFVLMQAINPWMSTFNALERYDLISVMNTAFGLLSGIFGIVVLTVIPTMTAIAAVRFTLIVIRFFVSAVFVRRFLHGLTWPTWSWKEMRPMLGFGGWVYLSTIGRLFLTKANNLILTTFLGSAALPYYEVPQRVYTQIHSALGNQSQFLFPMLASYGKQTSAQIKRLEDRLRWFIAVASGAIYTGIALIGPDLLGKLVNEQFGELVRIPLYLACVQGFFQSQDIVPYFTSHAMGLGKPNSVTELTQGIVVAGTAYLLIPRMGVVGASISQLWVIAIVIVHTMWVRTVIMPEKSPVAWVKTLLSPVVMVGAWLVITILFTQLVTSVGVLFRLAMVCISGLTGFATLILIEKIVFPEYERWSTLQRAITLLVHRVRNLVQVSV